MGRERRLSQYAKGWLVQVWPIASGLPFALTASLGDGYIVLTLAVFVIPSWVAFYLLRCRECGTSIFRAGPDYLPLYTSWPRRRCEVCGSDHRLP